MSVSFDPVRKTETSLKSRPITPVEKPDVVPQSSNQPAQVRLSKSTMRKFKAECVASQPVIEIDPKVLDNAISRLKKSNGSGLKRGASVKDFDYYLDKMGQAFLDGNWSDLMEYCNEALPYCRNNEERGLVYLCKGIVYAIKSGGDIYAPDVVHYFVKAARLGNYDAMDFCKKNGISY